MAESGSVHMMAALGISTPLQFCGLSFLTGCGAKQSSCHAQLERTCIDHLMVSLTG